jgi:DHA3 family tetracycline resistance protein-like MFS transporter
MKSFRSIRILSLVVVESLKSPLRKLTPNLGLSAKVLAILTLLFAAGGIGFALAGTFSLAVACLLFRGVIGAVSWPIYSAYQTQSVPSHVRATVLSMTGQGNAIGQVLGGPVVGWVGRSSLRSALVIAGLLILPNSALYRKPDASALSTDEAAVPGIEAVKPEVD